MDLENIPETNILVPSFSRGILMSSAITKMSTTNILEYFSQLNAVSQLSGDLTWEKIANMALLPAAFTGPSSKECEVILGKAAQKLSNWLLTRSSRKNIEIISLNLMVGAKTNTTCILYHSPSRCTVAEFILEGSQRGVSPPFQILKQEKCPLMMYDYRGCGLSLEDNKMAPSLETLIQDGILLLEKALEEYREVKVWGSSLGGGIAAASMEAYLQKHPAHFSRLSLYHHDSSPSEHGFDALTPLIQLTARKVHIFILCHDQDPVLPRRYRMAENAQLKDKEHVRIIHSSALGHANLSEEMIQKLWGLPKI